MASGFGTAVNGIVFGRGDDAVILGIVALHAGHKRDGQASAQERILAIGFLAASPARIAKDVDVRRPEIEALENVGVPSALVLSVFDLPFNPDGRCHLMNAW